MNQGPVRRERAAVSIGQQQAAVPLMRHRFNFEAQKEEHHLTPINPCLAGSSYRIMF